MIDSQTVLTASVATLVLFLIQQYWFRMNFRQKLRHPPSPRSLPFVGHAFSLPSTLNHISYLELGKQLDSNIIYLNMMGQPLIVLNSAQTASDMLEKHSSIYSDRIGAPMVNDPTSFDWSDFSGLLPLGDLWRRQRRRMNSWLNVRAIRQFDGLQQEVARRLLGRLLDLPASSEPFREIKHQTFFLMGSATFKSIYGYDFKNEQDPFFVNGIQASLNLLDASIMSNFLVNLFPALSKVPDWFPGTAWKRTARKWREQKNCAVNAPYEWAKQRIATGDFEPSILSALLNDNESGPASSISEDQENELKQLVYGLFIAGTDTTAAGLMNFIAAMVCNPEAQVKAQAEIDSVIGYATRLPTISDEAHLPYVRNLILEVSRWLPIGPTGGPPHVCSEDNVYQGYDIEKGTMIIGNLWAMSRDETVYENPESFEPERFADPKTPPLPGFGWGRRKCPGMHFAEASLFFVISSLLTTFTFSGKKDENGKEIIPNIEVAHNSLVIPLKPFEFELRPRSEKHRQLIIENIPQD